MTKARVCQREGCGKPVPPRNKQFCSRSCRTIYEKARKRQLQESAAMAVVREHVEPVVREALTDKVLGELATLVQLIPEAVQTLKRNLSSEDEAERRQAATLILRYAIGQIDPGPAKETNAPAFQVNFGAMPQQGEHVSVEGSVLDEDPEIVEIEMDRMCLECGNMKPADEFVGESNRCRSCHEEILESIRAKFPGMLHSNHASG